MHISLSKAALFHPPPPFSSSFVVHWAVNCAQIALLFLLKEFCYRVLHLLCTIERELRGGGNTLLELAFWHCLFYSILQSHISYGEKKKETLIDLVHFILGFSMSYFSFYSFFLRKKWRTREHLKTWFSKISVCTRNLIHPLLNCVNKLLIFEISAFVTVAPGKVACLELSFESASLPIPFWLFGWELVNESKIKFLMYESSAA